MTTANRRNYLWSLLVTGAGVILLLLAINVLPESIADLLRRSWGILFVIAGLNMLLIDRVRFGNWLALLISAAVLGIIIYSAYNTQAQEVRTDYIEEVEPVPLGDNIQGVTIDVESLSNTVSFIPAGVPAVGARFIGSTESRVSIAVQEDEVGIVNMTVREARRSSIPKLEEVGQGELQVFLPIGVPIETLDFVHQNGFVTLDFRFVDIPRFDVTSTSGDMDVFLPEDGVTIGDISIEDGRLRLIVNPDLSLRVAGAPSERTTLNTNNYQLLADGTVESRGGLVDFQFNLRLNMGSGSLAVLTFDEWQALEAQTQPEEE